MPAGPVGSVWAAGSWSDTAWEADTWADAVVPPVSTLYRRGKLGRGYAYTPNWGTGGWLLMIVCEAWRLWR